MKIRKTLKSPLRIAIAVIAGLAAVTACYWLWNPGADFSGGTLDQGKNALWIGHGWLGDDGWMCRNGRDPKLFRNPERIVELLETARANHIKYLYPHMCPAGYSGNLPPIDDKQVERFLDKAAEYDVLVIPWVGGVNGESARIDDQKWRQTFVDSTKKLLAEHPRLAGVQLNIEPLPSGDRNLLTLLEELSPALKGKILSVAAYPPPTMWQPHDNIHWEPSYLKEVAKRCNQLAVMMYDTGIRFEKFYVRLMRQWTQELQTAISGTGCELLLGIPAYDDAGVGYHDPAVENLASALSGIAAAGTPSASRAGCAIYCEWHMTPGKWLVWQRSLKEAARD